MPQAWQSAPEVSVPKTGWQSAPAVSEEKEKTGFLSGAIEQLNPLPAIAKVLNNTAGPVQGLGEMGIDIVKAHGDQVKKGIDAWNKGEHTEAIAHFGGAALPLLGPAAADIGEKIGEEGFTSENMGRMAGLLGGLVGPKAVKAAAPKVARAAAVTGEAMDSIADATLSKETLRQVPLVGKLGVSILERAKENFAKKRAAAQKAAPPRVIRDPGERGIPPVLNYEPAAGPLAPVAPEAIPVPAALPSGRVPGKPKPKPREEAKPQRKPIWADIPEENSTLQELAIDSTAPAALPSGRRPGGIQNQKPTAPPPQAPPDPVVPLALDAIAKKSGFDDFASAPEQIKPLLENALAAELDRAARTAAPVEKPPVAVEVPAKPNGNLAAQLRDEMLKNGSITEANLSVPEAGPAVTTEGQVALRDLMREVPEGAPKAIAKSNYAGSQEPQVAAATYEAAGRAAKADALSQMFHDEGLSSTDVAKWKPKDWLNAATDRGVAAPSKASIAEVIFRLKRLEGAPK